MRIGVAQGETSQANYLSRSLVASTLEVGFRHPYLGPRGHQKRNL